MVIKTGLTMKKNFCLRNTRYRKSNYQKISIIISMKYISILESILKNYAL